MLTASYIIINTIIFILVNFINMYIVFFYDYCYYNSYFYLYYPGELQGEGESTIGRAEGTTRIQGCIRVFDL